MPSTPYASRNPTPRQRAIRNLWLRSALLVGVYLVTMILLSNQATAGKTLRTRSDRGLAKGPVEGVLNINEATAHQLTFLPRIGLKKAGRIVQYRLRKPFRLIGHLARVKGIGRKTVRSLRPWLRLNGPTTIKRPISRSSKRR